MFQIQTILLLLIFIKLFQKQIIFGKHDLQLRGMIYLQSINLRKEKQTFPFLLFLKIQIYRNACVYVKTGSV